MFGYAPDEMMTPLIAEPSIVGRLGDIRAAVAALPCQTYSGRPGRDHCGRCRALALIDDEIAQAKL